MSVGKSDNKGNGRNLQTRSTSAEVTSISRAGASAQSYGEQASVQAAMEAIQRSFARD